ncbi:hypothetical protein BJX70DRAFT_146860 [Aspergillus crustosus]
MTPDNVKNEEKLANAWASGMKLERRVEGGHLMPVFVDTNTARLKSTSNSTFPSIRPSCNGERSPTTPLSFVTPEIHQYPHDRNTSPKDNSIVAVGIDVELSTPRQRKMIIDTTIIATELKPWLAPHKMHSAGPTIQTGAGAGEGWTSCRIVQHRKRQTSPKE